MNGKKDAANGTMLRECEGRDKDGTGRREKEGKGLRETSSVEVRQGGQGQGAGGKVSWCGENEGGAGGGATRTSQ